MASCACGRCCATNPFSRCVRTRCDVHGRRAWRPDANSAAQKCGSSCPYPSRSPRFRPGASCGENQPLCFPTLPHTFPVPTPFCVVSRDVFRRTFLLSPYRQTHKQRCLFRIQPMRAPPARSRVVPRWPPPPSRSSPAVSERDGRFFFWRATADCARRANSHPAIESDCLSGVSRSRAPGACRFRSSPWKVLPGRRKRKS